MSLSQKTRAAVRLIRPELPAAAGVCVVTGQAIALGQVPPFSMVWQGFLLGFFLSSSAMIFNDYFDLEVDRVNAPGRPLPSGLLSPYEAIFLGIFTAIIALAIALAMNPFVFGLCLITWILGFLYNWKLKAAGLWGNLIVSYSVAMTFIIGGVSVGQASNLMLWVFGLIAFFFDLAEEIAGDAVDIEGDLKRSSKSIAIVYGKKTAMRASGILFSIVVILTFFPIFWGEKSLGYFVPITIMDGLIIFFTARLLTSRSPLGVRKAMRSLYLSASLCLVAFFFARFIQ
jgi:geranylgeranylglycerol-phosphate geranylgeranyltransferase